MSRKITSRSSDRQLLAQVLVPIAVAVLGLIGTVTVAYFQFLLPNRLSIEATQTAEAKLALTGLSPTATSTSTPTFTPTPASNPTPTNTSSPIPTNTPTPKLTDVLTNTPTPEPTHTPILVVVSDNDFEDQGFGPWKDFGWPDGGGTRAPDATDCVFSGKQALKITQDTGPEYAGNVVMQEIPSSTGQFLRFSAWLRILELSSGEAYVELVFAKDEGETELIKYTGDWHKSSSEDWTQIEVEGIAPEGTEMAKLKLVVMYAPQGRGMVCFDDISVYLWQQ